MFFLLFVLLLYGDCYCCWGGLAGWLLVVLVCCTVVSFLLSNFLSLYFGLSSLANHFMDGPYRNRTVMSVIVSLYELACCGQIKCTHGKIWNNMQAWLFPSLTHSFFMQSYQLRMLCEQQKQSFSWFCLPQNVTKCKIATIKIEMTEQRNDTFVNNRLTTIANYLLVLFHCIFGISIHNTVYVCDGAKFAFNGCTVHVAIVDERQKHQCSHHTLFLRHTQHTSTRRQQCHNEKNEDNNKKKWYVLWIKIPLSLSAYNF